MKRSKNLMKCNVPEKSWKPHKKRVVKACSGGKEKIIHYGAVGYGNNYNAVARRSFRARHKCSTANDKLTARYWACKDLWTKGGDKEDCPSNRRCKGIRRSPKRRLPKRRSPKRRSPKRRSPKRRSPKRRSPKRRSPTRRSPKRRSPKRRSHKRRKGKK